MAKGVFFKNGYLVTKKIVEVRPTKSKLTSSLTTLQALWKKGLKPKDLKSHLLLTWFAVAGGNILRQAEITGLHRNHIVNMFGQQKIGRRTLRLRQIWLKIHKGNPKQSFESLLLKFYKKVVRAQAFTPDENKNLVQLWLMRFPEDLLIVHYVLCAFRGGLTWSQIAGKLPIHIRTMNRIRLTSSRKGSLANRWLYPLKPKVQDWYPKRL